MAAILLWMAKRSKCPHAAAFKRSVNMSPAKIRAWHKDPRAKLASSTTTRGRLPKIAKLKAKPVDQWTAADCRFARRVVNFNTRFEGMKKKHGATTKICVAMRNWGRTSKGCRFSRRK